MPSAKTGEINKMFEEMLILMKHSFNTYIESMTMLQNQSVRILNTFADQGLVTQKEAHKIIREWSDSAKRAATEIKKITNENFSKLEEFCKK